MKDYQDLDDIDYSDTKEFASSDGCLKPLLAIIIAILGTALILHFSSCSNKITKPKTSYEKIYIPVSDRGQKTENVCICQRSILSYKEII